MTKRSCDAIAAAASARSLEELVRQGWSKNCSTADMAKYLHQPEAVIARVLAAIRDRGREVTS